MHEGDQKRRCRKLTEPTRARGKNALYGTDKIQYLDAANRRASTGSTGNTRRISVLNLKLHEQLRITGPPKKKNP